MFHVSWPHRDSVVGFLAGAAGEYAALVQHELVVGSNAGLERGIAVLLQSQASCKLHQQAKMFPTITMAGR